MKRALTFVCAAPSRFTITILSPTCSVPSVSMMFAVWPIPTSSWSSRTIPFDLPETSAAPWESFVVRNCWASPMRTASSSGIPTPYLAETGIIETCFRKSLMR